MALDAQSGKLLPKETPVRCKVGDPRLQPALRTHLHRHGSIWPQVMSQQYPIQCV